MAKKKPIQLREVRAGDYCIEFKKGDAVLTHKDGTVHLIGCGVADVVSVFSDKNRYYMLEVNYPRRYACLEVFRKRHDELEELVLAEPKDIEKIFGDAFVATSPKKIAERLTQELG